MIEEKLISSREIIDRAIKEYNPYAIVLMLSGGDDSMTALAVAKYLNVPITHIMHGITGTGIKETTDFVRKICADEKAIYLEADAGTSYVDYVMRKGFFGVGNNAHNFSYRILKYNHFGKCVSKNIRQNKRNRNVLFVNGARRLESKKREKTMINPIKIDMANQRNIWVNIINEWEGHDCKDFLSGLGIERNPVSIKLCRSGECMCGTMQTQGDRNEAGYFFPDWKEWVDTIEKAVKAKGFNWGWGENMPKKKIIEQTELDLFQPMCTGCKINYGEKDLNVI